MKKLFSVCLCSFLFFSIAAHGQKTIQKANGKTEPQLVKQLRELIDYSDDQFDSIEVALDEAKSVLRHKQYKTSFALEGAIENYIIEHKSGGGSFTAIYGTDLPYTEIEELYNKLSKLIRGGFSDDFKVVEKKTDLSPTGKTFTKELFVSRKNEEELKIILYYTNRGLYVTTNKPDNLISISVEW